MSLDEYRFLIKSNLFTFPLQLSFMVVMFMSCIRIPSLPQNHEDILLHYIPEVLQFCLSHLGGKYFRMSILYKIQGRFSLTVSHIHVFNCPSITAYRGGSSPLWLAIPHYAHGSVQLLLHWSVWYLCQCHITTAVKSVSIYCNTKLLILLFFRVSSYPREFPYPLSVGFSREEYWSRLPCPPPGDLHDPGIQLTSLMSPALAGGLVSNSPFHNTFIRYHFIDYRFHLLLFRISQHSFEDNMFLFLSFIFWSFTVIHLCKDLKRF